MNARPAGMPVQPAASHLHAKHWLIVLPDDTLRPVLESIETAHRSINVRMFVFENKELLAALVRAKARGLHVRVMLNNQRRDGSSQNASAAHMLSAAGVEVRAGHPRFELTHEKSLVLDDRIGFVQSMNWRESGIHPARDYAVVTEDALELGEMIAGFDADWERRLFAPRAGSSLIWCPDNGRARVSAFIDAARRSLWVQNERYQDSVIIERLARAALRGVKVHVLANPLHRLKPAKLAESLGGLRILRDVGAKVHAARHMRLHAKMMVADHRSALVGSINFSPGSFDHRRELAIETTDAATVARLAATARSDWSSSVRMDLRDSAFILRPDAPGDALVDADDSDDGV
ncbi:phospholipase D-like domain-containing protein [Variovorax sp. J22P168]|uniref:phospholipase D-like domain-containing protein n=1 Tax=Variovorax jilinensis TaxID=3053513 RepID=UPI002576634B|nr:phospholipase D-like domain-containing protein [Variovorax sp. J22P168]MDM0015218.1 phospholipase D-like domain-containing protein [Variovorax sp. J22P168]